MALCVVCGEQGDLYCKEDKANLCFKCDKMIHERNPLATAHTRIPICQLSDEGADEKQGGGSDFSNDTAAATAAVVPQLSHEDKQQSGQCQQQDLEYDVLKNDFNDFFRDLDSSNKEEMFSKEWDERLEMGCKRVSMNFDTMEILLGQKEGGGEESSGDQDVGNLLEPVPTGTEADKPMCILKAPFGCILANPIQKVDSNMSSQTHFQHSELSPPPFSFQHMINSAERCSSTQEPPNSTAVVIQPSQDPDRAAKLARYRAKRARRNFKKTIRYESRKAYAEIRPRIKGRFATKAEVEAMKLQCIMQQQESPPQQMPPNPIPQTFPPIQVDTFMQGFEQMQQGYMVVPTQQQLRDLY